MILSPPLIVEKGKRSERLDHQVDIGDGFEDFVNAYLFTIEGGRIKAQTMGITNIPSGKGEGYTLCDIVVVERRRPPDQTDKSKGCVPSGKQQEKPPQDAHNP